jgi:hypothetical protein
VYPLGFRLLLLLRRAKLLTEEDGCGMGTLNQTKDTHTQLDLD